MSENHRSLGGNTGERDSTWSLMSSLKIELFQSVETCLKWSFVNNTWGKDHILNV